MTTQETKSDGPAVLSSALLNINWDVERATFEQWYVATQTKHNYIRVAAKSDGTYIDGLVRIAWRAWKKAIQRGIEGKAAFDV